MQAVLFDLDDTLFDHQYARRAALRWLQGRFPSLARASLHDLEIEHERLLVADYGRTLDGTITPLEARTARTSRLCALYGEPVSLADAQAAAVTYEETYRRNRQAVLGAFEVVDRLRLHLAVAIVTNGNVAAQREKLELCGLTRLFGVVVVSEELGVRKPDPRIFQVALERLGVAAEAAVYVGDSWPTDVMGALGAGLRAVWFNRYEQSSPDPDLAPEIRSLPDLEALLGTLEIRSSASG